MPCTYEETSTEIAERHRKRDNRVRAAVKLKYKKELDKLTRMLCGTLQAVEKAGNERFDYGVALPKEVVDWQEQHKKQDAARGEPWKK